MSRKKWEYIKVVGKWQDQHEIKLFEVRWHKENGVRETTKKEIGEKEENFNTISV